jgi:hypothetical protein
VTVIVDIDFVLVELGILVTVEVVVTDMVVVETTVEFELVTVPVRAIDWPGVKL